AAGVVEVFRNVLERSQVNPQDVVFLAHSTTQATNALLEGDVAAVGVIGMASRVESVLARGQSNVKDIELAPGRFLRPSHRFITTDRLDEALVRQTLEALRDEGAQVVVASSAFGVDDQSAEELVMRVATELGLAVTGGHEITKLYGLTTRTRTAVINASILPKMIGTANMTEQAVREAGISAPLMIMRGDGGVMDVQEMRRRPVVTMLSGPAASVAGALMYLRVSDGIYFEVGGTSTNIGVIRNGRPTVKHARVGGHDTYVNSLDVRVIGIAGGSMVRVRGNDIHDVGPRSAHIAGLHYAAFARPEDIIEPQIELFRPKDGDPDDYLAIRCLNGERYALTTTCAANILGYAKPGWHAHGNVESARRAFAPLAQRMGSTVEEAARRVLVKAASKVTGVVEDLVREYKLDRDQAVLIGEGGGAASLIPFVAETMKLDFKISQDAEVISSIGVALALVRETIERVIPNPGPEDLQGIKREAFDAAVRLGAAPENVEVTIEVDAQTQRVRAIAMGASEMRAQDMRKQVSEEEAADIAATSMGLTAENVKLAGATADVRVFQAQVNERKWRIFTTRRSPVRAVDREGVIRIQRSDGVVTQASASDGLQQLRSLWESVTIYNGDSVIAPDMFVVAGRRIVDLCGITALDQAVAISRSELEGLPPEAPVVLISMQGARGL
ncbi:MAG TPA: hydantoinase/oxoprolinase family protein, partial [Burkholderiales bacterium]|nr:hydantoinase/oxoprolinase family protein [Burkholderiales bacterium]